MADLTPHINELNEKLHPLGVHAVSAQGWYQQQAQLAMMRESLTLLDSHIDFHYKAESGSCFGNFEDASGINAAMEKACEALQSDAGKAFAERVQALERLYDAVKRREVASTYNPGPSLKDRHEAVQHMRAYDKAQEDIDAACAELEAMNSVSNQPGSA